MDARITKSRLANFLSYDWLKILLAVVFVIAALSVFFTTVRTRPKGEQEYSLFAYSDLTAGEDAPLLGDSLYEKGVFSYDVLLVNAEGFGSNMLANAAFNARRSTGQGNSMFIGNAVFDDGDDTTEDKSMLQQFVEGYLVRTEDGGRKLELLLDARAYFEEAGEYLVRFYGENWREEGATQDAAAVEECFLNRNGKDKRFKTAKQKAQGIESEKGRIAKLRADLLAVEAAFGDGTLTLTTVETEYGAFTVGVCLGNLPGLSKLYYYTQDNGKVKTVEEMNLVLFNNGSAMGDLKFETVSLLRYFLQTYA